MDIISQFNELENDKSWSYGLLLFLTSLQQKRTMLGKTIFNDLETMTLLGKTIF